MKYNININQKTIIDSGIDIDYKDAAILDTCMVFCHSSSCVKMEFSGKIYYWFNHSKIATELPLLSLKKDSVYRRMKKMCDLGLISQHPDNDRMGKSFYCFEDSTLGLYTEPSDKKPNTLGKPSAKPSDKKPTYHYTNDHYTIINNISSPSQAQEVPQSDFIIDFVEKEDSTLEEKIIKQFHNLFCKFRTKPGEKLTNKTLKNSKMSAWKKDLDKLMRIDERTRKDLLEVYNFLDKGNDDFWRNTIYSISAIREYWDKIQDKMRLETLNKEKIAHKAKEQPKEGVFQGNINRVTK